MSSTNKTTNYELSQYIGTDKPTYLGDYNSDMQKIDTQMKRNADGVSAIQSTANTALENANVGIQKADNADTKAETAQSTATSALEKSTKNEASINEFNLTSFSSISSGFSITNGELQGGSSISFAKNNSGSLGKIYGKIGIINITGQPTITFQSPFRPSENIIIQNACSVRNRLDVNQEFIRYSSIQINTNGLVTISPERYSNSSYMYVDLLPFLYWFKNFGDSDIQPENS